MTQMSITHLKPSYFTFIFIGIVLLDLVAGTMDSITFRHFTKPLILLSLFIYFAINGKNLGKTIYVTMLFALFFSWLGDVMLMYDYISGTYFILGLASFLIAHVLYTIIFIAKWKKKNDVTFLMVLFALTSYGILLFWQLKDNLGEMRIPVIVYVFAIMTMAIAAFKRKNNINQKSFILVFLGALFFIASDSLLAINKFLISIPYPHIMVMATYATAQYLITRGVLFQNAENKLTP